MPTISRIGYCKYIVPEGGPTGTFTEPLDVIEGRGVNFSFNYSWSGNDCTISKVRWKPGKIEYNSATHARSFVQEGLESEGFHSTNDISENRIVLKIQFGQSDSGIVPTTQDGSKSIWVNKIYSPGVDNWSITINTSNNFLLANFKYEYTGTSTGVTYIVEIKDIKIPRTNKYENNVIFNKDGLNELIDNIKKYPIVDISSNGKYGYLHITHGDSSKTQDLAIKGFTNSTSSNMYCETNFRPDQDNKWSLGGGYVEVQSYKDGYAHYDSNYDEITGGESAVQQYLDNGDKVYRRYRWQNLYLSGNIGSSAKNGRIGNIYATNGNFSESIKGKYEGLPNGLTGDSININNKFKVDDQGNVTMQGNITWADNQFAYIYHKGKNNNPKSQPPAPSGTIEIDDVAESDSLKRWHKTQNSHGDDYWISITYDNGTHWTTPTRYRGIDGEPGKEGYWTNENILEALKEPNVARGLYWFPGEQDEQTHEIVDKLALKADVVMAALGCFNKIEMDPGNSYDGTQYSFNGGYISFSIPSPIRYSPAGQGWRARLGYLQGNGDGTNPTGGIGFAIHTTAVWNDFNNATTCNDGTSSNTKHLLLSCLMLTQSGLGLMVSKNMGATEQTAENWCKRDNITISNNTGHYTYRWWSGSNQGSNITRYYRLWLDENNGMLYWYSGQDKQLKCWVDPTDDAP